MNLQLNMKLHSIEVTEEFPRWLNIIEITESGQRRGRAISPDMDISGEVQEIKDKAVEVWTDDIKASWATFKEEERAAIEAEQALYPKPE